MGEGGERRQEGSWSEDVRLVRRNVLDVCRNSTIADCLLHLPDLFCRPVVNSDSMKSDGSQPPGRGGFFSPVTPGNDMAINYCYPGANL